MSDYIVIHGIRIAKDFVPETFGRLTTLGPKFLLEVGKQGQYRPRQVCVCVCGNVVLVNSMSLRTGGSQSCGCFHKQQVTKHGLSRNPEYKVFDTMKHRCISQNSPKYEDYGGRGVLVCDRWLDPENGFTNFIADMGPRPSNKHSIDRIDNDGNYCPENCRWATTCEQSRNRRSNRMLIHNGRTQCMTDWAAEAGICKAVLRYRLKTGWDLGEALSCPPKKS
jgi:hypothetical protein